MLRDEKDRIVQNWSTHRVRSVYNKPLQQNPCDLFLDSLGICFSEQSQDNAREIMRVTA